MAEEALLAAGQKGLLQLLKEKGSLDHVLLDGSTKLPFLGDVLATPKFFPRAAAFSVGDMFIMIGVAILVHFYMVTEPGRE